MTGRVEAAKDKSERVKVPEGSRNGSSPRVLELVSALKCLSLGELLELEGMIREEFGLEGFSLQDSASSSDNSEVKEAAKVSLILEDVGSLTQVEALKTINKALSLSISEAKAVMSSLPYVVLKEVDRAEAERLKDAINGVKEGLVLTIS